MTRSIVKLWLRHGKSVCAGRNCPPRKIPSPQCVVGVAAGREDYARLQCPRSGGDKPERPALRLLDAVLRGPTFVLRASLLEHASKRSRRLQIEHSTPQAAPETDCPRPNLSTAGWPDVRTNCLRPLANVATDAGADRLLRMSADDNHVEKWYTKSHRLPTSSGCVKTGQMRVHGLGRVPSVPCSGRSASTRPCHR